MTQSSGFSLLQKLAAEEHRRLLNRRIYRERRERERAEAEAAPKAVVQVGEAKRGVAEIRSFYRDDFEGFCSHAEVFAEEVGGAGTVRKIVPFLSTQERFLRARTKRDVILKARQQGFTTLEVARDCWYFLTRPGARTVVVVQSDSEHGPVKNVSRMVKQVFAGLANDGFEVDFKTYTERVFELRDGSVLEIVEAGASVAKASKTASGYSIQRLHVTEVAKFEQADLTMLSLTSCVSEADGTEVTIESTACGASGYFYDKWQDTRRKVGSFTGHFFPWHARSDRRLELSEGERIVPRDDRERTWFSQGVSPEQVKWYRRKQADVKHQDLVDQDFPSDDETCFRLSGNSFFSARALAALKLRCREPWRRQEVRANDARGEIRYYHPPDPKREYEVSADPSEGTGGDPSAAHVRERGTGRLMAVLDGQIRPWALGTYLMALGRTYNWARIGVERNNHGGTVLQCLRHHGYPNVLVDDGELPGWYSTEPKRVVALDKLSEAITGGHWECPDAQALADFFSFVVTKTGKAEAAPGKHDDHVLCAAIGWDMLTRTWVQVDLSNLPKF